MIPGQVKQVQVLVDDSNEKRLVLEYIAVDCPQLKDGGFALDFHALHLQSLHDSFWQSDLTITCDDFRSGSENRRWISQLHSFDPANQIAILQIGTEETAAGIGGVKYCWYEWNLGRNCPVRPIKVCENPFDKLDD